MKEYSLKRTPKSNNNRPNKKKTSSQEERQKEIKKMDRTFSTYIRLAHADSKGKVQCYTCTYKGYWKKDGIQCGHFRSRGNFSTRWSVDNARPQCVYCNENLSGNIEVFTQRLIEAHGEDFVERVTQESKETKRWTTEALRGLRLEFEKKIKTIREEKGI